MYRGSPYLLVVHHLIWLGNGIVSITAFGEGKGGHLELGLALLANFHCTIPESLDVEL